MHQTIPPIPLTGTVPAIPSKSMAHRLMICAALAGAAIPDIRSGSADLAATRACLTAMAHNPCVLPCGESGSTLRFLLPVAAALGLEAEFLPEGRLPQRPLAPLDSQLEAHGVTIFRPAPDRLRISGRLRPGDFTLPGNVSSQFLSGLLLALPLLDGPSTVTVTGRLESAGYVDLTLAALARFGVTVSVAQQVYRIAPQTYVSPGPVEPEGDWSNAAFWLCAGALSGPVTVTGLNPDSLQGDRVVADLLAQFGASITQKGTACTAAPGPLRGIDIDAAPIPDLIPALAMVAAAAQGTTTIRNAARLRLKESDRLAALAGLLRDLGGQAETTADTLIIHGGNPLTGGTADSCGDHRIAMAAAIAAILCQNPVTVLGAEAVEKSYPNFWNEFDQLSLQED